MSVRRATLDDVPTLARTLARAFDDDPVFQLLLPKQRIEGLTRFFDRSLRVVHLPLGEAWVTDDLHAAALWAPPGRWRVSVLDQVKMLSTVSVFGRNTLLGARMHAITERHHPRDAHFYLAVLGVDPDFQGKGLGAKVLAPILDRCDGEHFAAYLESSNERNHGFYRRQGFVLQETLDLGRGARAWTMRRTPRT